MDGCHGTACRGAADEHITPARSAPQHHVGTGNAMSNTVRAWLLLIVTLLLGVAIGVLAAGALQDRRFARVNDIRRPGGFTEHLQEVIRPTSDSQWNAIRPFVETAARENTDRRRLHDGAMRASLDSLRIRLEPLLDAAQRERLARFVPGRRGGPSPRDGRPPRRDRPDDAHSDDHPGPPPDGPPRR